MIQKCNNCNRFFQSGIFGGGNENTRLKLANVKTSENCPYCGFLVENNYNGDFRINEFGFLVNILQDFGTIEDVVKKGKSINLLNENAINDYCEYLKNIDLRLFNIFNNMSTTGLVIGAIMFITLILTYYYFLCANPINSALPIEKPKIDNIQ